MSRHVQADNATIEATLTRWRHKATHTLSIASALVYLPVVAIVLAGKGPPMTRLVESVIIGLYGIILLEPLLWQVDYRIRVGVNLVVGYVLAFIVGISLPQGPFIRAFPLFLPLIAMVFFGKRAGRIAIGISILILLSAPFLSTSSLLIGVLVPEGEHVPNLPNFVWFQGIALTAILLQVMVLLERFHKMLMQSLADRTVAYQELKAEMRERRRLEHEVARITDDERRRLGHEIHDGVCQQLTAALLRSEALTELVAPADTSATDALAGLTTLLEETIDEARAVAQGLCPLESDPEALAAALRTLAGRIQSASGIACVFETEGDVRIFDATTANHLYRIAQEATSNVIRHAHANRIVVALKGSEAGLLLEVEDDGDGLPGKSDSVGMGLRTMSYRAGLIDGSLTATPGTKRGTRICCHVPCGGKVSSENDYRE